MSTVSRFDALRILSIASGVFSMAAMTLPASVAACNSCSSTLDPTIASIDCSLSRPWAASGTQGVDAARKTMAAATRSRLLPVGMGIAIVSFL